MCTALVTPINGRIIDLIHLLTTTLNRLLLRPAIFAPSFIDHLHLQVVQHLRIGQLLFNQVLWQDDMAQVGHQVCVYAHVYLLSLLAQHVDQLNAHRLDVERRVLTQVQKDLQAIDIKELAREFTWTSTVVVILIKQQHMQQLEHLYMKASTRLHCQALGYILDLSQYFFPS